MASKVASKSPGRPAPKTTKASISQLGWDRIRAAPVVLISGTERYLADRALRSLRELLLAEDTSLEISDIDADLYAPGDLITLASPSLFGEPRLIRVSNVEKCTDAFLLETLSYLQNPADGAFLVLRHAGGVRGKKLLDAIRSGLGGGIEIVCAEIKRDTDRHSFAAAEFAAKDRRVSVGALRALVSAFVGDLAELAAACRQLISDTTGEITEQTVNGYYAGRLETTAFQVADAAIAGRYGESLVLLRHALASGADPVPIVAAIAMKLRVMAKVSGVRGGSGQIASVLGLAPWQVDRAQSDLRGWDDAGLGRAIVALAQTDAAVKGAERDPVFAVERLLGVISARGGV